MCLCWPFHDYVVKKAPEPKPKKEPEELQYHVVQPGDTFYPVNVSPNWAEDGEYASKLHRFSHVSIVALYITSFYSLRSCVFSFFPPTLTHPTTSHPLKHLSISFTSCLPKPLLKPYPLKPHPSINRFVLTKWLTISIALLSPGRRLLQLPLPTMISMESPPCINIIPQRSPLWLPPLRLLLLLRHNPGPEQTGTGLSMSMCRPILLQCLSMQ